MIVIALTWSDIHSGSQWCMAVNNECIMQQC